MTELRIRFSAALPALAGGPRKRRRIGLEHQGADIVDEGANEQHRRRFDLDERDPVQRANRREVETEVDGGDHVVAPVPNGGMDRRQRQAGRSGLQVGAMFRRLRRRVAEPRCVMSIDHEALTVDGERRAAAGSAGETECSARVSTSSVFILAMSLARARFTASVAWRSSAHRPRAMGYA